jgi:peptide deformylase
MAQLDILIYPDPRLHEISKPVAQVDDNIRALIDDMAETMYAAPGIGLAAPQVNHRKRIILVDISQNKDSLKVFINPQIIAREGSEKSEEGCLSVPDVYAPVSRAERVRVRALDRYGDPFELDADGLLAVCIQHEIDHLDGKVFVDYLSRLKQDRIRKKMSKFTRHSA